MSSISRLDLDLINHIVCFNLIGDQHPTSVRGELYGFVLRQTCLLTHSFDASLGHIKGLYSSINLIEQNFFYSLTTCTKKT